MTTSHLITSGITLFPKKVTFWATGSENLLTYLFSSVQSLSRVRLFATPWITAHQASLSITNSRSSLRLMSIESVMPSSHVILCHPLLLLPPIPPSIRVFANESTLRMRWPKYWSFSFSIIPSKRNLLGDTIQPIKLGLTFKAQGRYWQQGCEFGDILRSKGILPR